MSALEILTQINNSRPLSLGQVAVNKDGVLELREAPTIQKSQFNWLGTPVHVSISQPDGESYDVCDIIADLGPLPFSAQNPELRGLLIAVMRGFKCPKDCRIMLGARGHIWLCQQTILSLPLTPAAVLGEIAVFLHGMTPIIRLCQDLIAAYGPPKSGQRAR